MLRQIALVVLLVAVVVNANYPRRRHYKGNKMVEREFFEPRYPKIMFERAPSDKRVLGAECIFDSHCDKNEVCSSDDYCIPA